ncbi:TPA: hypothetical protein ACF0PM_002161 [Clostridium perfringens]|uniref:hypothetical protein n=1 Tax=Clostridium perfringens TaxID=1502 RepID=UPI000B368C52|nr:hypothetical protein [Clostridium perfringens]OUN49596.1 hypothetical protein B5G18_14690 [Clostridium perfringens]OUP46263.1 hypothetical protein B5F20_09845 [Clostridium perfringens]
MKKTLIKSMKEILFNLGVPMILKKSNNLKVRKIRLNGKVAGKIVEKNLVVYIDGNTLNEMLEGGIR